MSRRVFSRSGDYTVSVSVPRDVRLALERICEKEGVPMSRLVKGLLRAFVVAYSCEAEVEFILPSGKKIVFSFEC